MTSVSLGQPIPPFSGASTSGKTVNLSDFAGKNLVLYFYPKDDTPGCTQEGQDFRDLYPKFQSLNTEIVGVSRDSVKSHERFKCKFEFPFELIADDDETLCSLFDVMKMKNMYGKQVRGVERSTFLIDSHGSLAGEWRKVSVKGHAEAVLAKIEALAG
jgi:peroxiredoxin Q/BCP